MSVHARRELIWSTSSRYRAADRVAKSRILDEFCASTGYNRKYACGVLTTPPVRRLVPLKRTRPSHFSRSDVKIIEELWEVSGRLCGKRLAEAIPNLLDSLIRHDELLLCPEQQRRLASTSASTLDRLLAPNKRRLGWKGKTTTKPGTLLKHQISVRTFADWNENRPGFFEADLVAHCGETIAGDFAYTLTLAGPKRSPWRTEVKWPFAKALKGSENDCLSKCLELIRTTEPNS